MNDSSEARRSDEDEIDLGGLFAILWARRRLIGAIILAGVVGAIAYAFLLATPLYEARSTLVIEAESNGPRLGNLEGLAALSGFSVPTGGSASERFEDRVKARDFILSLPDEVRLMDDPFFNPSERGFSISAAIKTALQLRENGKDEEAALKERIVEKFRENVFIVVGDNGVISVRVRHESPKRAAKLANSIVNKALTQIFQEKKEESRAKVEYLASEIYRSREDLEKAAQKIEEFTVESRLVSEEQLGLVSSELGDLRQKRNNILSYQASLEFIGEEFLGEGRVTRPELARLLNRHPEADNLEFRRLLGWSGNLTQWSWPGPDRLELARIDVADWLSDVDREISASQALMRDNAVAAGELAKLQREVDVQETIYKVLLQQFESQNLAGGFEGAIGKTFETAVPPVEPASPKKPLILALGTVLGLIAGSGLALVLHQRHPILYTRRAISDALDRRPWAVDLGRRFSKRDPDAATVLTRMTGMQVPEIEEVVIDLERHSIREATLLPTSRMDVALAASMYIAKSWADLGRHIALLDPACSLPPTTLPKRAGQPSTVAFFDLSQNISLIQPEVPGSVTAASLSRWRDLARQENECVILICPPVPDGASLASAALTASGALLVTAKPGTSSKPALDHVDAIMRRVPEAHCYLLLE